MGTPTRAVCGPVQRHVQPSGCATTVCSFTAPGDVQAWASRHGVRSRMRAHTSCIPTWAAHCGYANGGLRCCACHISLCAVSLAEGRAKLRRFTVHIRRHRSAPHRTGLSPPDRLRVEECLEALSCYQPLAARSSSAHAKLKPRSANMQRGTVRMHAYLSEQALQSVTCRGPGTQTHRRQDAQHRV